MTRFFRSALFPLIVIVLLVYLASQTLIPQQKGAKKVTYSDLITRVKEDPKSIDLVVFTPNKQQITVTPTNESDPKVKETAKGETLHGWPILKQAEVKPADRAAVLAALTKSIEAKASGAKCFDPGHGVRVIAGKKQVDLVICFKCDWVHFHGGDRVAVQTIGGDALTILDRVLEAAK